MKKTVCVDVDGVLARYDGWKGVDHFGEPIHGAKEFLEKLSAMCDVVIYTTRCCEEINKPEKAWLLKNRVRDWLDKHGLKYSDIFIGQGKPIASAYVDDRAISCRPQEFVEGEYEHAIEQVNELLGGKHHEGVQQADSTFDNDSKSGPSN